MITQTGGGDYSATVTSVGEFLNHRYDKGFLQTHPSYLPGTKQADLRGCLPDSILDTLKRAITDFGQKLRGFDSCNAVITAAESRTSAPVRILRKENCESVNIKGLFPAGEGSGYSGGIVSSAIDGIKAAYGCIATLFPGK